MQNKQQTFMMKMRPEIRELLDMASKEQRRTRVSLIEELIVEAYGRRYASSATRLRQLLEQAV
jgi:predicted DNA-binding protein